MKNSDNSQMSPLFWSRVIQAFELYVWIVYEMSTIIGIFSAMAGPIENAQKTNKK